MKKIVLIGIFALFATGLGLGLAGWYFGVLPRSLQCRLKPFCQEAVTADQETQAAGVKNIIFDLGGVLLETDSKAMTGLVGTWRMSSYLLTHQTNPIDVLKRLINFLCEEEGFHPPAGEPVACWYGEPMPPMLCAWQKGQLEGQKAIEKLCAHIQNFWERQQAGGPRYFASKTERDLIIDLLRIIFDVRQRIQTTVPVKASWQLLERLAAQKNEDGTRRYRFFVLSNVDAEMVPELHKKFPQLFTYFDGGQGIYSGCDGCLKPEPAAYETLCKRYSLDPQECLFIDDQEENVHAARAYGMLAAHWNAERPKEMENLLHKLNIV